MKSALRVALALLVVGSVASCKKKNNSPTGPSNTQSAWTGTLTRPGGSGTMTVSWPTTTDADGNFSGPMTLTLNGVSFTIPTVRGGLAGNSSGYSIHISFTATTGEIASQPTCSMNGSSAASGAGDPFPSPYNVINVTLTTFTTGCQALFGSSNTQETWQLNITK
jgi:hypothetical protein